MLRDITIGQHFPGDSLVHKFDPRMKLVLTIVYIILLFAASNPLGLTLSLVFLVAMYGVAKIPFKLITKSLKPILPIIGKACAGLKAYKKAIDGLIFVYPREIPYDLHGLKMGYCERPLRASTPQGERVSIAKSESVPAGSTAEFEIECLDPSLEAMVRECLDYGTKRGLGQWRNSGKGRYTWEEIKE